ncbi:MAG: hypothetical protein Q9211_001822 [Gyalolechia sp. 1 TL-2023]
MTRSWWKLNGRKFGRKDYFHKHRGQWIDRIREVIMLDLTPSGRIDMEKSLLRFCLFEDLKLRHVCCRLVTEDAGDLLPPVDAEEARELQEDEPRTQRFHDLLPKAELEYQTRTPFSEFWAKFYIDNIINPHSRNYWLSLTSMRYCGPDSIAETIASSEEDESSKITAQATAESDVRIHEIEED